MEGNGSLTKRFVVDSMLGKVAKWLRILGYDTRYEPLDESKMLEYTQAGWLVLTRRQSWCGRESVICLHHNAPMDQVRELHAQISLRAEEGRYLGRCIRCNEPLEPVDRQDVFGLVPEYTFETVAAFHRCSRCRRVYWEGSHTERMAERLKRVLGEEPPARPAQGV
jgi:uncharacterized protein with PIN domain